MRVKIRRTHAGPVARAISETDPCNDVASSVARCHPVMAMGIKKMKLDAAVKKATAIIHDHLGTLPAAEAKAMRKDLHKFAVKSSQSASRGKASRSCRSAGPRPLSHASAKSA